jgi:hypothetical protein
MSKPGVIWVVEAQERNNPVDLFETWAGVQFSSRSEAREAMEDFRDTWSRGFRFRVVKYVRARI